MPPAQLPHSPGPMTPSHIRATYRPRKATLRRTLGTAALLLVGLLTLPTAASAQGRADRFEQRIESLLDALDLSDAQADEVRALFDAERATRPARDERGPGDREARRAARTERRAEMERQLGEILTPEQMETYRTWRDATRPRDGRRGGA